MRAEMAENTIEQRMFAAEEKLKSLETSVWDLWDSLFCVVTAIQESSKLLNDKIVGVEDFKKEAHRGHKET